MNHLKNVYFTAFLAWQKNWKLILSLLAIDVFFTLVPQLESNEIVSTFSLVILQIGFVVLFYNTLHTVLNTSISTVLDGIRRITAYGRFIRNGSIISIVGFLPFMLTLLGTGFFFEEAFKQKSGDLTATPYEPLIMAVLSGLFSLVYFVATVPFIAKALTNIEKSFGLQFYENVSMWKRASLQVLCGPFLFFIASSGLMYFVLIQFIDFGSFSSLPQNSSVLIKFLMKLYWMSVFSFFISLTGAAVALQFIDTITAKPLSRPQHD